MRLKQLFLAIDEGVGVIGGYFKIVAVGDGIARASFHAIAAEDTAVIIDVIHLGVALRGADAVIAGILRCLDVDAIGRASRRAEEASDAFLQPIFITAQDVDAAIARFKVHRFGRIILRHGGFEHHFEGCGESLHQRHGGVGYFLDDIWHNPSRLGRTVFGLGAAPKHSISDGIRAVKFSAIPSLVIGASQIIRRGLNHATRQHRKESKKSG